MGTFFATHEAELYHYGRKGMKRGRHLPDVLDPKRELHGVPARGIHRTAQYYQVAPTAASAGIKNVRPKVSPTAEGAGIKNMRRKIESAKLQESARKFNLRRSGKNATAESAGIKNIRSKVEAKERQRDYEERRESQRRKNLYNKQKENEEFARRKELYNDSRVKALRVENAKKLKEAASNAVKDTVNAAKSKHEFARRKAIYEDAKRKESLENAAALGKKIRETAEAAAAKKRRADFDKRKRDKEFARRKELYNQAKNKEKADKAYNDFKSLPAWKQNLERANSQKSASDKAEFKRRKKIYEKSHSYGPKPR